MAAEGLDAWAARIWGAADSERKQSGIPVSVFMVVHYETNIARVRSRLREPEFTAAWGEGQTMTLAQILTEA
jgi:hypothetical protein